MFYIRVDVIYDNLSVIESHHADLFDHVRRNTVSIHNEVMLQDRLENVVVYFVRSKSAIFYLILCSC